MPYPVAAARGHKTTRIVTSYYVNGATGNDSTGNGSLATPWATISKALATVPAAGGVNIVIAAGTYAENTGASGFFNITQSFTNTVTLTTLSGAQDVIITGASNATIETILQTNTNHIQFVNLSFAMRNNTTGYALRLSACNNIQFVNCKFTVSTNSGSIKAAVQLQPSGASTIVASFSNCQFVASGTDSARGVQVVWTAGNTITMTFNNCTGTMTGDCIYCNGGTITVNGGTYTSSKATFHTLAFGADSNTGGNATTAVVTGANITFSAAGHALLFGNGCSNCSASGNTVTGGDYAIVLKEHTGTVVDSNTIIAGTAAACYFKASTGGSFTNNTISGSGAAAVACKVGAGDTGNKCANDVFTTNSITLTGAASVFAWGDSTADSGGGVCDYNSYNIHGTSGNLGTVRSTSGITTLVGLQGAWSGYTPSGNDAHSTVTT